MTVREARTISPEASPLVHPIAYGFPPGSQGRAMFRARAEALAESWRLRYLAASGEERVGSWRDRAACGGIGADRWWKMSQGHVPAACSVCATCPVRMACVQQTRCDDDMIPTHHITAVSGGFTGPTRVALQRRLRGRPPLADLEAACGR